jgi:hypothetical protein
MLASTLTEKIRIDWTSIQVWFFSNFKRQGQVGNGDIGTHPEPIPETASLISNYIIPLLN